MHSLVILFITCHILALRVTPNSPCASQCTESTNTIEAGVACENSDLVDGGTGSQYKQCMGCLQNSTYSQGDESDQGWFLCEHSAPESESGTWRLTTLSR